MSKYTIIMIVSLCLWAVILLALTGCAAPMTVMQIISGAQGGISVLHDAASNSNPVKP